MNVGLGAAEGSLSMVERIIATRSGIVQALG
jgi:hypothetical protein